MGKITVSQENNYQELVANQSPGSAFTFKLKRVKFAYAPTEIRRQAFISSFKKILRATKVNIFPQAKWTVSVNETDIGYVIWVNI